MKTFSEWVQESHPEDEVLNEFLRKAAKWAANTKPGRAAILTGAMLFGGMGSTVKGAAPMPPSGNQQYSNQNSSQGYSKVSFNKKVLADNAHRIGLNKEKIEVMDDYTAWYKMMKRLQFIERNGVENSSYAEGYDWFGQLYNHGVRDRRAWLPPAPPEVLAGGGQGIAGGD
jgi:hypothetical protein